MKTFKLLIAVLAVLFLAGCTVTGNVIKETDDSIDSTLQDIRNIQDFDEEERVEFNDVDLYLTNGGFSPAVIEAKAGQNIVVTSYYVDDVHFSIAELGVEEPLSEADTFEFVVEEKGEYPYICLDCSPMIKGVLLVE